MKKWIHVPKMLVAIDIPEKISSLPDGWQKEVAMDALVSNMVMQHVEVTEFKEGEYAE